MREPRLGRGSGALSDVIVLSGVVVVTEWPSSIVLRATTRGVRPPHAPAGVPKLYFSVPRKHKGLREGHVTP